ncbi:uncharacterized protein LOC121466756 [Drosophila elegans]|uniref:uncharacterized protein LOC121466756 n=1 Tax=Drosophila elegans TaxID=30023 RepID=UPI001BC84E9C|nr:uncharacterized protein LOC121466756 [Drosophila elegans]
MSFSKSEEVDGSHNMSDRSLVKNGFFNYLRDFCQRDSALSWPEIAREGARSWKHLSEEEKSRYQIMSSTDTDIVALQMNNKMCNHPMGRMGGGMINKIRPNKIQKLIFSLDEDDFVMETTRPI